MAVLLYNLLSLVLFLDHSDSNACESASNPEAIVCSSGKVTKYSGFNS